MAVQAESGFTARQLAWKAGPVIVVALAGVAVRTPIAAAYPFAALLFFVWIVSDTLMLALMARTSGRPDARAVLGVMAGASLAVWLGAPSTIRHMLLATPAIAAAFAAVVLAHVAWATARALRVFGEPQERTGDRWIAAVCEVLPTSLVHLAAAELMVIHMALFRWGGSSDVPANCRAFSYHKHLTPMGVTLLILSAIEIAVYHLFVGHWSRTAAIVMFVLSDVGFVYLLGLIKSFRFRPVLLTPEGVRIRAGFLIDQSIPLSAIAGVETSFAGERVRDPMTLNAALLAWPNILLRLDRPVERRSLLKAKRSFSTIAFRLDDPEPFVRLLLWRLGSKAT